MLQTPAGETFHPDRSAVPGGLAVRWVGSSALGPTLEHAPVCRNCQSLLDLAQRDAVQAQLHRNVACPGCGILCILEGPQANVAYAR